MFDSPSSLSYIKILKAIICSFSIMKERLCFPEGVCIKSGWCLQCPQDALDSRRESMIAEADMASMFQQILEEQVDIDPGFGSGVQLRSKHRVSLDKSGRYGE